MAVAAGGDHDGEPEQGALRAAQGRAGRRREQAAEQPRGAPEQRDRGRDHPGRGAGAARMRCYYVAASSCAFITPSSTAAHACSVFCLHRLSVVVSCMQALRWIQDSFMYVRMLKKPDAYGARLPRRCGACCARPGCLRSCARTCAAHEPRVKQAVTAAPGPTLSRPEKGPEPSASRSRSPGELHPSQSYPQPLSSSQLPSCRARARLLCQRRSLSANSLCTQR